MRRAIITAVVLVGAMSTLGFGQYLDSVSLVPPSPTIADPITVHIVGYTSATNRSFDYADFVVSGTHLTFSLYWVESSGMGAPIMDPFTYDENVGPLSEGPHQLTVKSYVRLFPIGTQLVDQISTPFTVIPEPGAITLLLVGGGLMYLRRRKR